MTFTETTQYARDGKWHFLDDEERCAAIQAEAESASEIARVQAESATAIADYRSSENSRWWIFWTVFVLVLGAVSIVSMITGNTPMAGLPR